MGLRGLGFLPGGENSYPGGLSADGSTVVGARYLTAAGDYEAFIWDAENGMRELDQVLASLGLDFTGWTLLEASKISADGQVIVGVGRNPDGYIEAWLAVVPEPGTAALVATGLSGLASVARRCRSV